MSFELTKEDTDLIKKHGLLPYLSNDEIAKRTLDDIDKERSGEQLGLFSSWQKVNIAMGKYCRFNTINLWAAPTGHGKSFILTQLEDDFTDIRLAHGKDINGEIIEIKGINYGFSKEVVIIHFGFEMDAEDEFVRSLSRVIAKSTHWIRSAEWVEEDLAYNKITDKEFAFISNQIKYLEGRNIYFIERIGNVYQMYATILNIKSQHPNAELVIDLDHTLLTKREDGQSDGEVIQAVAFFALAVRKRFGAMLNIIAQCNSKLEDINRISKPALHGTKLSDIYFNAQINWVCDNVWIMHRPELFNIEHYSTDKIDATDLVVFNCVKSRRGKLGEVLMKNYLHRGRFVEFNPHTDIPQN